MDFKFSFGGEAVPNEMEVVSTSWIPSKKISLHEIFQKLAESQDHYSDKIEEIIFGPDGKKQTLRKYRITEKCLSTENHHISELIKRSDLEPGIYEGGFKLWECSVDLLNWVVEQQIQFKGKKVLELGCGHALPGIFSLLEGGNVTFQDYNCEVIHGVTIRNVLLNISTNNTNLTHQGENTLAQLEKSCEFYEGDWHSFNSLLLECGDSKFDLILSSDTLYNVSSYPKLYSLIRNHLHPKGMALIAAKSYYFGVGGSVSAFIAFVQQQNTEKPLSISRVKLIDDGESNIREILSIRRTE